MEVSQSIAPAATAGSAASQRNATGGDFETFLRMLTVQLQNQDPLNPVESADYAVQLATFSSVEQQVRTNQLLEGLADQLGLSGLSEAAGWVGKEVRIDATVRFTGTPVDVSLPSLQPGQRAEISVRDGSGQEVQRFPIFSETGAAQWTGIGSDGSMLPPGTYSLRIGTFAGDSLFSEEPAEIFAEVREVRRDGPETTLLLADGQTISSKLVTGLRLTARSE